MGAQHWKSGRDLEERTTISLILTMRDFYLPHPLCLWPIYPFTIHSFFCRETTCTWFQKRWICYFVPKALTPPPLLSLCLFAFVEILFLVNYLLHFYKQWKRPFTFLFSLWFPVKGLSDLGWWWLWWTGLGLHWRLEQRTCSLGVASKVVCASAFPHLPFPGGRSVSRDWNLRVHGSISSAMFPYGFHMIFWPTWIV